MNGPEKSLTDRLSDRVNRWSGKPLSLIGHLLLMLVILASPCWLFGISRLPGWVLPDTAVSPTIHRFLACRLHSDDFAYIGSSRNLGRTIDNLFVPHNTHICPSWRILTWSLVSIAGDLTHIPVVLGIATYFALVLLMLMAGHFVAHETGRLFQGFLASLCTGLTSIQWLSTLWYSAGQTIWAAIFILSSLILAQLWLRHRWAIIWLPLVASCWIAGGFWTIGHASGPVTAIYLLARLPRSQWRLALIPFLATVLAIVVTLTVGGEAIDATNSFHGRNIREAVDPIRGVVNTAHSILETMILGNLGINAMTTDVQSFLLVLLIIIGWACWHRQKNLRINSLEWAGSALFVSAYLVEWTFRGYFSWIALKNVVPWYDTIPLAGWVIFISGVAQAALAGNHSPDENPPQPLKMSRMNMMIILTTTVIINLLHQPEIDRILVESQPPLTTYEIENRMFPIQSLRRLRAAYIWDEKVKWQRRQLERLHLSEQIARREGWSVEDVSNAVGRVRLPMIPKVYDAVFMMDLPLKSQNKANPDQIRLALSPILTLEKEPTPEWLRGKPVAWPPEGWETKE